MKKWVLIFGALLAVSCENKCETIYFPQLIEGYYQGKFKLEPYPFGDAFKGSWRLDVEFDVRGSDFQVILPDGTGEGRYGGISERNGDLSYNGVLRGGDYIQGPCHRHEKVYALADNLTFIHVFSDVEWDEAHPAGKPLDDLITIVYGEYGSYVRSGYRSNVKYLDGKYRMHQKYLSQVEDKELEMIGPDLFQLRIPRLNEPQTLTVEWTTTEGEVKWASVVCEPRQ